MKQKQMLQKIAKNPLRCKDDFWGKNSGWLPLAVDSSLESGECTAHGEKTIRSVGGPVTQGCDAFYNTGCI